MSRREWPNSSLGGYCTKIGSGSTPRGGDQVYQCSGTTFIRSQNVYNGLFSSDGLAFLGDEEAERLKGVTVESGDVLLNITGDSVARCCQVPETVLPARVNQHVAIVRPDPNEFDANFLMYFLISPQMQSVMLSLAGGGGTRKALTKEMIQRFEVPKPPLPLQQRVAATLSAYDDLIENNRRRIALLEESARLLYQEWFVHLRFPGHEHTRISNGLPQGWRRAKYSEFVDFLEGPGLRNYQYRDSGVPFLNIRTIQDDDIDFSKVQYLDEAEVQRHYRHFLLAEDDHVVSSSGTLGRVATVRACHLPVMLNTSIIRMRPKSFMTKWFLKAFLKHGSYMDQVTAVATGAAQLNYGPSHLSRLDITIPSESLMKLFDEYASHFYRQIKVLLDSNRKLYVARDILLPRLMSGETRFGMMGSPTQRGHI